MAGAEALGKRIDEHIAGYGADIEHRLTGMHETAPWDEFSYGVSDRGASVRIPWQVEVDGKGYLEDRRPNANCDPYVVTRLLVDTICSPRSRTDGFAGERREGALSGVQPVFPLRERRRCWRAAFEPLKVVKGATVDERTPDEVLALIADEDVEVVDVRFCDLPGLMQHFSIPPHSSPPRSSTTGSGSTARRSAASRRSRSRTCS